MSIFEVFKSLQKEENPKINSSFEYIVAGLGNPELKYENTRHNTGFMAIENIEKSSKIKVDRLKFQAYIGEHEISGKRILLMKPQTYMNNSGESISKAMSFYKIPPEKTIIIYDDISLPVGKIRIRRKGSHGGHNGMKNIINLSGSSDFPRIKIGVGAKPNGWDLVDWVLSRFSKEEMSNLHIAIENACLALEYIVNNNFDEAMNKFN